MFILNEEIKEQERQAIRELYPKFPDTQVIVTKVPLKPFYKTHRIQFVAMAHVTKILAKYGYLEVSGDKVALLRALQELTFIKVGDNRIQKVDFNLVCTTNVELWDLISKGGFRSDLYYRISHVRFNVPPVRDYYNIPGLMEFLIDQVCEEYNLTPYIDKHDLVIETMQKLHPYKGNIREIKSYLTTELIKLDASRSSTLTGIELMKTTPL